MTTECSSSSLEAQPVQYYQKTLVVSNMLGYTISTIQDFVLNEFRTVIYSNTKADALDLSKYEVTSGDQKNALHVHMEALRYINSKLALDPMEKI
jgi:hypothetical protein